MMLSKICSVLFMYTFITPGNYRNQIADTRPSHDFGDNTWLRGLRGQWCCPWKPRCLRRCGYVVGCFGQWAWRLHHCCPSQMTLWNGPVLLVYLYVGSILCLEVGALTCDLCRCRSLKQVYMFNQGHWSINIDLFVWRSTFYSYLCVCFLMPHCTHILVHIQNQILPECQAWMILDAYEGPEGHVMVSWEIMSVLHLSIVPCFTNNELFVSGWCVYAYIDIIDDIRFNIHIHFIVIILYIFMFIFHLVIHVSIFSKNTVLVALH